MIFIKEWLHHHVSDHSACNHFIQLAVHTMPKYTVLSAYEAAAPISGTYTYPSPSQRMVYLQGLLADSEQLLLERPGHEALWCLRRSLLEMLLRELLAAAESSRLAAGTAAKLLGDYALCAAPLPQSTNSSPVMVCCKLQWRSFCPSVFEPASGAVDSAADDVDWEALRLRRICTKNGASDSSIDTASYQPVEPLCWTTFYSTLSSADIGGDYSDVADVTVAQLVAFLRAEVKFCCRCATVRAMWGFEEQRRLALRYVVFALDRAQRLFASHTVRRSCSTSVATVADAFAFGALALRRLVGVKSMSMIAAASSSL